MEEIKTQIMEILIENSHPERSATGLTGEIIIYDSSFDDISEAVCNIIQIVFDPENQPNQLGINNPFAQRHTPGDDGGKGEK